LSGTGANYDEPFIIDSGADSTVLTDALRLRLNLAAQPLLPGAGLVGIGGSGAVVAVSATLVLTAANGSTARFHGGFTAFTAASPFDYSLLGRDVLEPFWSGGAGPGIIDRGPHGHGERARR
jgi:hypothetical protein